MPDSLPLAMETHRTPQTHVTGLGVVPPESDLVLDLLQPEVAVIRGGKRMDNFAKRIVEKQQAEELDRRDVGATCLAFLEFLGWAEGDEHAALGAQSSVESSAELSPEEKQRRLVRRPARRREYGWLERSADAFAPKSPEDLTWALQQLQRLERMTEPRHLDKAFPRASTAAAPAVRTAAVPVPPPPVGARATAPG